MKRRFGPGTKALTGIRTRGRRCVKPLAGAPKQSGNWHDDDATLSLAVCLIALEDAGSINDAAINAVLIRAMGRGGTFTDLSGAFDGATERSASAYSLLRKRVRRVRDKLYAFDGLADHVQWLRSYPALRGALIAYRDRARLFGKGRAALLQ